MTEKIIGYTIQNGKTYIILEINGEVGLIESDKESDINEQ